MKSVRKSPAGYKQFFKILAFFLFSLAVGIGVGYLLITYLNFDIVHRKGTTSTKVLLSEQNVIAKAEKLPFLPDTIIKNVIIFIGDGMGLNQITATRYRYHGPYGRLNMERMPVTGLVSTFAAGDALITDSGAGGTALSTGYKTGIGMVGVDQHGESRTSIMEAMKRDGYKTGLITTSDITDATPGAFSSHVSSRKMKLEIVRQLIESKVNVLVSGGETYHGQELEGEERISVIDFAEDVGYKVVNEEDAFFSADHEYVLALFEGMASDKLGDQIFFNEEAPTLAESTQKAISLLQSRAKGFILVVEEEGVDSGSHINRIDFVTSHLKNLDDAVNVGLEFALKDRQTLVLVVADHETGGLTLVKDNSSKETIGVRWSTDGHTGQPVPLFAFGPHAVAFTGLWDNTDFSRIIAELIGLHDFPEEDKGDN